jgi:twitching motility protein PilT
MNNEGKPMDSNQNDATVNLQVLLAECVGLDASDLHLSPGLPPYFRVHGILGPAKGIAPIAAAQLDRMAEALMIPFGSASLQVTGAVDGATTADDGTRFRFNVYRRQGHFAIAFRRLEDRFRTLVELGMPESLYQLSGFPDGLVVVSGPTGSGKSTTLATLLDRINQTRQCHIVTIEDPIEYLHPPKQSLINQRQIGSDVGTFNDALVASLRQDPDVILVGEVRDLATIRTAISAAETGHLVLTTVHASDCVGSIERLISVFPADEQAGMRKQLSLVLRTIVTQHLLIADGVADFGFPNQQGMAPTRRMRVAASEVLMNNAAVANLIATGKSAQVYMAMETGAAQGMHTMEQDLARLLVGNHISEMTACTYAKHPSIVRDRANLLRKQWSRPLGTG